MTGRMVRLKPDPTKRERGAELVEFALVLPLMLLLGLGTCDFGLIFQRYEVVTNAAREGARAGAVGLTQDQVKAIVGQYLEAGGLKAKPTVAVEFPTILASDPPVNGVSVSVSYPSGALIVGPLLRLFTGTGRSSITLTSKSTMRLELAGS